MRAVNYTGAGIADEELLQLFRKRQRAAATRHEEGCWKKMTEVIPKEPPDVFQRLPPPLIVPTGLLIGEIFDLEELAPDGAQGGCYEFLFGPPPLRITGAVGSSINLQAVK